LLFTLVILLSCTSQNPETLTIGELLSDSDYNIKMAQREIHEQIENLQRKSLILFGVNYDRVLFAELKNEQDSRLPKLRFFVPVVKENRYLDSSNNYFIDDYYVEQNRIIDFYRFNDNYQFETTGRQITLPQKGPFAWPWHQPVHAQMEYEVPGISFYNPYKRVLHIWNIDGTHYDSYNFNFNDEYFYLSTGISYVFDDHKGLVLGIPFTDFPYRFSAFKPMEKPIVYRHDINKQSFENITIQASPHNGNEAHPLIFLENPYGGYLYFYAAAPEILFLSDNLDVSASLNLSNYYDKYGLQYHYENYRYMIPWGDIFNISDRYLVISSPLYHLEDYRLKKGKTLALTMKNTEGTRHHFLGRKDRDNKRFVLLIDKKERKVVRSEIFDAGFNYNHQYRTGMFFECEMYFMKDLDTIVYLYKVIEPNEKTAQIRYFSSDKPYRYFMSVYKREKK